LCHTNFSFLTGASHPHELVNGAANLGYSGLAITDYDGVYGIARAYRSLKLLKDRGASQQMKLNYGAEIHLRQDHKMPLVLQDTVTLIAQSLKGYYHLCKLLTLSHKLGGKNDAYVSIGDILSTDVDDLVVIFPMRGLIRGPNPENLSSRIEKLIQHFNGRCYFAVSRFLNQAEDCFIKPTVDLVQKFDVPIILSQDLYFHHRKRKGLCDILQAIRLNKTLDESVNHMFVNGERSLHDLRELDLLYREFPFYEQALLSSRNLAESCQFDLNELKYKYPKEMIPESYDAQSYLEFLCNKTLKEMYQGDARDKVRLLLDKELRLVDQLQFADYFLTIWDIVRWARSQGILCQGRGSAANSVICFLLGVTSVSPEMIDLLFERFLSVERGDPPDIDVDFEHERREEVIQYIYSRYGRERAAMVANVITYRSKGAMRAVGKALGITNEVISLTSKALSERSFRRLDLSDLIKNKNKSKAVTNQNQIRLWGNFSQMLKSFPRHLGIHSGGFIISDKPIHWLVPQEPATMDGRSVVQWCKEDIEALGFFKFDILALGMLTAIRKCLDLLRQHQGVSMTLQNIPKEDAKTYEMIQKADTVGVFQIESRAQMSMLPRLRPKCFYDLVIEIAIIRPGPIQGGLIHPFLNRRFNREPITYAHPKLQKVLERTLGVPIFQEQVMRIAVEVGDFTTGEADELRRYMGSWQIKGDLGPWIKKLTSGMRRRNISEDLISQLVGQMKGFSEYGFPESHSASFALLAYASSYLKCHYPAAFTASLLNSQPMGFYSVNSLLQDAIRHGVEVLPVCINKSQWQAALEDSGDQANPAIRLGFDRVTSFGEDAANKLIHFRERSGGSWDDLESFLKVSPLYRGELTALAAADAFHTLGVGRRASFWLAEAAPFLATIEDCDLVREFSPESPIEKVRQDFRSTSTSLGEHPASIMKREFWCFDVTKDHLVSSEMLSQVETNQAVHVFGMVVVRQAPPTAKGMVFLSLEDEKGFLNLVFTPSQYQRYRSLINGMGFLCVKGQLQGFQEGHSILVSRVYAPLIKRAEVLPIDSNLLESDSSLNSWQDVRNYM